MEVCHEAHSQFQQPKTDIKVCMICGSIIIFIMSQVDRRLARHVWYQDVFEKFPFTLFSGIQSFMLYQNLTDFLGGVVEYPIALIQYPYYLVSGQRYTMPSRGSEIQSLLNVGRFRSFHADVI